MTVINVYIIDDSPVIAHRIRRGLEHSVGIKVAGCGSVAEFMNCNSSLKVDIAVANIPINSLNVKSFVSNVIHGKRIPLIVLVENQDEVIESIRLGVSDCVIKVLNIIDDNTFKSLAEKIRLLYNREKQINPLDKLMNEASGVKNLNGVIAIGASTGGTEATIEVLTKLPRKIPGIVVTQHMLDKFIGVYAQRLNRLCVLDVKEACDNDPILPGNVLIAPGDKHMAVKKVGHEYVVKCFKGHEVSGHCPSVDVLFDSVADACGRDAVGIILTGMGDDGAKGLKKMHDKGAFTIGQGEEGCCVYGMPQKAFELGGVSVQRALKLIPGELMNHLRRR